MEPHLRVGIDVGYKTHRVEDAGGQVLQSNIEWCMLVHYPPRRREAVLSICLAYTSVWMETNLGWAGRCKTGTALTPVQGVDGHFPGASSGSMRKRRARRAVVIGPGQNGK